MSVKFKQLNVGDTVMYFDVYAGAPRSFVVVSITYDRRRGFAGMTRIRWLALPAAETHDQYYSDVDLEADTRGVVAFAKGAG